MLAVTAKKHTRHGLGKATVVVGAATIPVDSCHSRLSTAAN